MDRDTHDEWQLRVDLAAVFRLIALMGWDDLIFTHVSLRIPGPDHHFLINPYNLGFDEITASALLKVDLNGNLVSPSENFANPAGFTIHSALHMAREDAHAVIHLHTTAGQAVSATEDGLLPLTQTAMLVRPFVAYHDYEGLATDLDERERLIRDLGADGSLMILRNHGTLAIGRTIGEAFLKIYLLERACEAQIAALAAGRDRLRIPPDDVCRKTSEQGMGAFPIVANGLAWPTLRRRIGRLSPGFDA